MSNRQYVAHKPALSSTYGYDLDMTVRATQDIPYVDTAPVYQPFWALWGLRIQMRAWKRPKIFTRSEYLVMLFAIMPGFWIDEFFKNSVYVGATHIIQVTIITAIVGVPLVYADTFVGDYTKRPTTNVWRMFPISKCFLIPQLIASAVGSIYGSTSSIIYFQRLLYYVIFARTRIVCPEVQLRDYVCYDDAVHALSQRCREGDMWVQCPDNVSYILPSHYFYLRLCTDEERLPINIGVLFVYWVIIFFIAFHGLRYYVKVIEWIFVCVIFLQICFLISRFIVCGNAAVSGIGVLFIIRFNLLVSGEAWRHAFVVAYGMTLWGIPTLCAISSGLLFRTNRWTDSMLLLGLSLLTVMLFCANDCAVIGCLAEELNTRIETIWRPKKATYNDVLLPYYYKDSILGPIASGIQNLALFIIHMWHHGADVEMFVYSLADNFDLLNCQVVILVVIIFIYCPLSGALLQSTQCHDIPFRNGIISLRLLNGTAYAFVLFIFYGVQKLKIDHHFMYGIPPLLLLRVVWRVLPFFLTMVLVVDMVENFYYTENKKVRMISTIVYSVFAASVILSIIYIVIICRRNKKPLRRLLKPDATWGPPNEALRRARRAFRPDGEKARVPPTDVAEKERLRRERRDLRSPAVRYRRANVLFSELAKRRPRVGPPTQVHPDQTAAGHCRLLAEDVNFFELRAKIRKKM